MIDIDVAHVPNGAVVTVRGEADVFTNGALRSALFDPELEGPVVVIDLGAAGFVDSSTIALLIAARRWMRSRSTEAVLVVGDGKGATRKERVPTVRN